MVEIVTNSQISKRDLLQLAAAAEANSEHTLAQAIIKAAQAQNFQAVPGHGLQATVDGRDILIGNRKLMTDRQIGLDALSAQADSLSGAGRTAIYIALNGSWQG